MLRGGAAPSLNMNVQKSGITTGVTSGKITSVMVDVKAKDDKILKNQIIISPPNGSFQPFSKHGDSGSGIFDIGTNNVVALLWGGFDNSLDSVASPINPILDYFSCSV